MWREVSGSGHSLRRIRVKNLMFVRDLWETMGFEYIFVEHELCGPMSTLEKEYLIHFSSTYIPNKPEYDDSNRIRWGESPGWTFLRSQVKPFAFPYRFIIFSTLLLKRQKKASVIQLNAVRFLRTWKLTCFTGHGICFLVPSSSELSETFSTIL
jgi:hypothetical protein